MGFVGHRTVPGPVGGPPVGDDSPVECERGEADLPGLVTGGDFTVAVADAPDADFTAQVLLTYDA